MNSRKAAFTTFAEAEQFMGKRDERVVGNNTRAVRVDEHEIGVVLHRTMIVIFSDRGVVTLRCGGWRSVTTKARINAYIRALGVNLSQKDREWYLSDGIETVEFTDGVRLTTVPGKVGAVIVTGDRKI